MYFFTLVRRRVAVVLVFCIAAAGTAQESDRPGSFGPSAPAEVANLQWDITAYHPEYSRHHSRSALQLRIFAPVRFGRGASIDDVRAVYLYTWDGYYWRLDASENWSVTRQRLSKSFISSLYSQDSRALTIGPMQHVIEFSDGHRLEESLIFTPPGSDRTSALFVYEQQYAGDIGAAHVQMLSYAEVRSAELTRRPDGGGNLAVQFLIDDSRVFTGRLHVIDADGDTVASSEYFRLWDGTPPPPQLNQGEELRTDGRLNTYTLGALSPTERERAAAVYILLLDGPDSYHYRSFSATVPIHVGSAR